MMDRDNITRTGARTSRVGGVFRRMAVHYRARGPAQNGTTDVGHEVHEGRRQTGHSTGYAGSRLNLTNVPGRSRLTSQPSSRTGENPPYGMIGRVEETSASFELRSAPRSYPTVADDARRREVGPRSSSCAMPDAALHSTCRLADYAEWAGFSPDSR